MKAVIGVLVACVALQTTAAFAEEYVFDKRRKAVVVWKSESAMKEGVRLLEAKQDDLAARYVACIVDQRTRVVLMPGGYQSFPIVVIEGDKRGCRGNVEGGTLVGTKK